MIDGVLVLPLRRIDERLTRGSEMPALLVDDMVVSEGDGYVDIVVRLDVASALRI